tara:strand:+ start:380 stop:598 length:219 start_codon:yes stop_codon:yes gene_type:complete
MNNLIYFKKDPILIELSSSIDKDSTKKMLAFKFFNGDQKLLENYLKENSYEPLKNSYDKDLIEPKSQLEFSF